MRIERRVERKRLALREHGAATREPLDADLRSLQVAEHGHVLADCRSHFAFAADEPEVSVEVNPGTIDAAGLERLRRAGCNRLSIGVQSFDDPALAVLGRIHSAGQARATVRAARTAGFENLSLDLMYGLPGQSAADWRATLEQALALGPDHLSLYELTIEPGTRFAMMVAKHEFDPLDAERAAELFEHTQARTADAGLPAYEISNHARPSAESRHNLTYWRYGDYAGVGPGAHGRRLDMRTVRPLAVVNRNTGRVAVGKACVSSRGT